MADWTELEVELIVADYFRMFALERAGKPYNKSEHRRQLLPLLQDRSEGSIEFKHQNISASLINMGQLYIKGYLPRFNYQRDLLDRIVGEHLLLDLGIEEEFQLFVEQEPVFPVHPRTFENLLADPPKMEELQEMEPTYKRPPIKVNYLEKEQSNRKLGEMGEELALEYEKWNLIQLGKGSLADRVEWVSKEQGDGAGFDILSKNLNGTDKYVEVKTTRLGKKTPFFFSANELKFSKTQSSDYHLYRLFDFNDRVRLFVKSGSLDEVCHYSPTVYRGSFA